MTIIVEIVDTVSIIVLVTALLTILECAVTNPFKLFSYVYVALIICFLRLTLDVVLLRVHSVLHTASLPDSPVTSSSEDTHSD